MTSNRRYYSKTALGKKTHRALPRPLHQELIYFTRQYKDKLLEYESLPDSAISSVQFDGMPKGSSLSDPTPNIAARRLHLEKDIEAIKNALDKIPDEYREGVYNHIVDDDSRWPPYADVRTWTTYQGRFLYELAKNLDKLPIEFQTK